MPLMHLPLMQGSSIYAHFKIIRKIISNVPVLTRKSYNAFSFLLHNAHLCPLLFYPKRRADQASRMQFPPPPVNTIGMTFCPRAIDSAALIAYRLGKHWLQSARRQVQHRLHSCSHDLYATQSMATLNPTTARTPGNGPNRSLSKTPSLEYTEWHLA